MAKTQVTGPVHHYVILPYGSQSTALYLGTAKVAPKIRIQRAYKKVFNDLTGQLIPFERIFQGEEGQIVSPLNRFNYPVYQLLAAAPRFGNTNLGVPTQLPGRHTSLDIGAKAIDNNCSYQLILQFPFSNTINSPQADGMPPCFRFPFTISEADDFEELGTAAEEIMFAFTAQQAYIPQNANNTTIPGGTWLYTNDVSGITLPTPD